MPPREGKREEPWGVEDVAGAPNEGWDVAVVVAAGAPREGNAGFEAESPPADGILKREFCVLGAAPAAGAAVPKRLGFAAPATGAAGVVDSAGFAPPKRPPPLGAGVDPNAGLGVVDVEPAPAPNRPPAGGWLVAGVAEKAELGAGVVEGAAAFIPPNKLGALDPGGGPAGVVEALPNKEPPEGPGVVEAPNAFPLGGPPPNNPPPFALGVAASVFAGVEVPPPKSEPVDGPDVF